MSDRQLQVGDVVHITSLVPEQTRDFTVGYHYRIAGIDEGGHPWVYDDANEVNSRIACGVSTFNIVGTTH